MCSCKRHGDATAPCTCSCPHPTPRRPMSTETTPDDSAQAEAERLYPMPTDVETGEPVDDWGFVESERTAYLRGRADERAQIAARRDDVRLILQDVVCDSTTTVFPELEPGVVERIAREGADAVIAYLSEEEAR